ncbi:integrase core domain-containing protein [Streptomyces olivoreticuli]
MCPANRCPPRVGFCFSNAGGEAFNSVLKVEYVYRHRFRTRAEERRWISHWITGFYNRQRLHSACRFKGLIDYECDCWTSP